MKKLSAEELLNTPRSLPSGIDEATNLFLDDEVSPVRSMSGKSFIEAATLPDGRSIFKDEAVGFEDEE